MLSTLFSLFWGNCLFWCDKGNLCACVLIWFQTNYIFTLISFAFYVYITINAYCVKKQKKTLNRIPNSFCTPYTIRVVTHITWANPNRRQFSYMFNFKCNLIQLRRLIGCKGACILLRNNLPNQLTLRYKYRIWFGTRLCSFLTLMPLIIEMFVLPAFTFYSGQRLVINYIFHIFFGEIPLKIECNRISNFSGKQSIFVK